MPRTHIRDLSLLARFITAHSRTLPVWKTKQPELEINQGIDCDKHLYACLRIPLRRLRLCLGLAHERSVLYSRPQVSSNIHNRSI